MVFVDRPTSSTTVVINNSYSLAFSLGVDDNSDSELSDSNQDCAQNTELVQDGDAANAHPELIMPTTQATSTRTAGPDQTLVQPNIKFPATLKGNKHCSFRSEWYKRYRWLEYSRERDAAYYYPCHLFNTEPRKYWETFTKTGFSDWKHAMGKDGIIPCHDCYKAHMQAIVSWQEYAKNKESGTSVANSLFRIICHTTTFPSSWKISRITPVYKKGARSDPINYRSIAVLPTLSCVFEQLLITQLQRQILPHLPPEQFGFLKGSGTSDAGVSLASAITTAINN